MARAEAIRRVATRIIPPLSFSAHKGQHGRIGVIGGCLEYCGAPFYAASAALRCGADIVHIFCAEEASTPIKSFSPELIVHPVIKLGEPASVDASVNLMKDWVDRLHALVVGPGLGRDASMLDAAMQVASKASRAGLPVVLDADALWHVSQDPECFPFGEWSILTPNIVELKRLLHTFDIPFGDDALAQLSHRLNSATILLKGHTDTICSHGGKYDNAVLQSNEGDCPRRCGGQGDILAGTTGVFAAWAKMHADASSSAHTAGTDVGAAAHACVVHDAGGGEAYSLPGLAAFGGSLLTRTCAARAFQQHRRGMTTPDMLAVVPECFELAFPEASFDAARGGAAPGGGARTGESAGAGAGAGAGSKL